ncbi:TBC1 domain family member 5-like [Diadema antillarum]|uniref:TBC1 domain family member 5-like n=1 Tax=Diadema antillarum TaxID=105358 RepID=UPI003A88C307
MAAHVADAPASTSEDLDDDEETYPSSSTTNSYRDEWMRLFEGDDYLTVVRQEGKKGRLRSSRFRSVCWKIYLECLPEQRSGWLKALRENREKYNNFRKKHIQSTSDGIRDSAMDPTLNNPLSQMEESPWNKYFQDRSCRMEIKQDVVRCFPEIAFFKSERIQDMMLDILFCYAKENSHISYKQGMHELLAPLMFVIHSDQQAFLHAKEMESQLIVGPTQRDIVSELMNPEYLEHDSYTLFCHLMETAEPWFQHGQDLPSASSQGAFVQPEPFSKPQECNPSSPLVKKLNRIREVILKRHDYELYSHLDRLDIPPQLYGIRWIRLLFGREFTFQDLIVLWDAIFADSVLLDLVDYVFVAMLIKIRELLLTADYASALMLLMRYPTVDDIHFLVNRALHLRDPKNNPRQPNYQFHIYSQVKSGNVLSTSRGNIAVPKKPLPGSGAAKKTSMAVTQGFNSLRRIGKSSGQKDKGSRAGKSKTTEDLPHPLAQSADPVTDVQTRNLRVISKSGAASSMESLKSSSDTPPKVERLAPPQPKMFSRPRSTSKREAEMEQQLAASQSKVNELQNMCRYCATKMEAHIMQMQEELLKLNLETDDELFVSLAGLKQVKDILHGKLRFMQGLIDSEEIAINDDHYTDGEELTQRSSMSIKHMDQSRETFIHSGSTSSNNNNTSAPITGPADGMGEELETKSSGKDVPTKSKAPPTDSAHPEGKELQDPAALSRQESEWTLVDAPAVNGGGEKSVLPQEPGATQQKGEVDVLCNTHPVFDS